mmetsp:Transcript_109638/g.338441  ORF Transcript_109638/g.338441 Transcript_109638/m.338441 type:complete len:478 (+) Transcript_109638:78-1511(+)
MFIRHRGGISAEEQRQEVVQDRSKRKELSEEKAAVKIQSIWRGHHERNYTERRRCRSKPWGYFTHTLVLTYVPPGRNSSIPGISSKRKIYLLLEEPSSSRAATLVSVVIVSTIVCSIGTFMLETLPELYSSATELWIMIEIICTLIFTAEFGFRLGVCDEGGLSRLRFLTTPLNFFDMLAILPFYLDVVLKSLGITHTVILGLPALVRFIRLVRIFKLGRYASGMRLMGEAILHSTQAISVLVFLLCMGVVLFSSALFHVERLSCPMREELSDQDLREYAQECADDYNRGVSPKYGLCCTEESAPNNFPSIVAAAWWSMATMTTVGYGEIYPRTTLGKCVGFFAMLVGMVLIALPVAIVGQKFTDIYESHDHDEAKRHRTGARLVAENKVWSLVPSSEVLHSLRHLPIKDPSLAAAVGKLAHSLEEVWEEREQLGRHRRFTVDRHEAVCGKALRLLDGMRNSVGSGEADPALSGSSP